MNIYVGNLSLQTTEDDLRRVFAKFGEVVSITIMNDRYIGSGQPRGYGFVEMPSKSEGSIAIANITGKKLRSRVVTVVEALPLSDKTKMPSLDVRTSTRFSKKRQRIDIIS